MKIVPISFGKVNIPKYFASNKFFLTEKLEIVKQINNQNSTPNYCSISNTKKRKKLLFTSKKPVKNITKTLLNATNLTEKNTIEKILINSEEDIEILSFIPQINETIMFYHPTQSISEHLDFLIEIYQPTKISHNELYGDLYSYIQAKNGICYDNYSGPQINLTKKILDSILNVTQKSSTLIQQKNIYGYLSKLGLKIPLLTPLEINMFRPRPKIYKLETSNITRETQ